MPQTTPYDAILAQSRDLFRDRLCAAVAAMLDHAAQSLHAMADKSEDKEVRARYLAARNLAVDNRAEIEEQFRIRLLGEFNKRTNHSKKIGQRFSDFSLADLELVAEDDLNETLKFNDMAARLRTYCDEELSALNQRVGVLLGEENLEADGNPFGPRVICEAYKKVCRRLVCPADVRMVLLKLFDDHVLDTIRSSYKEVNALLAANSILPTIHYEIARHAGGGTGGHGEHPAPVSEKDMFAMLAKMLAPAGGVPGVGPPAGMGVGGVKQVQGAELVGSLARLQAGDLSGLGESARELGPLLAQVGNLKNVLHQLKSTSVGASMGQLDAMTLDICARLFDELFDDPKIPIALKGLIGRLQVPFLKVAIADKELFTSKTHPARLLLDAIGQVGMRLPPDVDSKNPTFIRVEAAIEEIVKEHKEGVGIFDKARAKLAAILADDDRRVASRMGAAAAKLQRSESLALGKALSEEQIRTRIAAAPRVPRPVVDFIAREWIKYLLIVHARDGDRSAAWAGALKTVDQLLWSVTPKATPEEQRKLAGTIPALLKALNAGVAAAGIDAKVAAAFFTALMKCHTEVMHSAAAAPHVKRKVEKAFAEVAASAIVRAPACAAARAIVQPVHPQPAPAPKPSAPPTPVFSSAVDSVDFTAPVTVKNPFGEGTVEVSSNDLDFTTPAALAQFDAAAKAAAAAREAAAALAVAAGKAPALAPSATSAPAPPARPASRKAPPSPPPRMSAPPQTIRLPVGMVVGAWVQILDAAGGEPPVHAKLHYVSPLKSHFLFVDRMGKNVFECSRSVLASRIRFGEVTLLDSEPDASLFDRIMDGLFGKLRGTMPPPFDRRQAPRPAGALSPGV